MIRVYVYVPINLSNERPKLAFIRHVNSMDPCGMVLEMRKAFEYQSRTTITRERAALARLKVTVQVEIGLQRLFAVCCIMGWVF